MTFEIKKIKLPQHQSVQKIGENPPSFIFFSWESIESTSIDQNRFKKSEIEPFF